MTLFELLALLFLIAAGIAGAALLNTVWPGWGYPVGFIGGAGGLWGLISILATVTGRRRAVWLDENMCCECGTKGRDAFEVKPLGDRDILYECRACHRSYRLEGKSFKQVDLG